VQELAALRRIAVRRRRRAPARQFLWGTNTVERTYMHLSRSGTAALAAVTLGMAAAAPAAAADSNDTNTYSVFSCRGPAGAGNAAAGWSPFASAIAGAAAGNDCGAGGNLYAALPGGANGGRIARWRFEAPAGTRIVRITATRRTTGLAKSQQPKDVGYSLVADPDPGVLEACDTGETSPCVADLTDPVDKQGLDKSAVQFAVTCNGDETNICPHGVRADFAQIVVGLSDTAAPTVTNVAVRDSGDTSGKLRVVADAADVGGGVYRTVLRVDGEDAAFGALGGADCRDADPANGDAYQFLVPVPCPASATRIPLTADVRTLEPGAHTVELAVEDAAGNSTTVYGPLEFPRPNGQPSTQGSTTGTPSVARLLHARVRAWFVKSGTTQYTSLYGTRVVVRGLLRDRKGHGIQGARIDVYHLLSNGKRKRLGKTGLKTRERGKFTLILPLNVDTRRIEFAYRALRPGKVTSRKILHLTVMRDGVPFALPRK
jgi:hypothetical protein